MDYREVPRPQMLVPKEMDPLSMEVYAHKLNKFIRNVPIDPSTVHTVSDLFCGRGILTAASLLTFSNATVHAVDYHGDVLSPNLQTNPRVKFHQGWVVDTLQSTTIPITDFTIISYANRLHGFTQNNIDVLAQQTKDYLLMVGDNNNLETAPWFWERFNLIDQNYEEQVTIWQPK
jgi:hypothetical protein